MDPQALDTWTQFGLGGLIAGASFMLAWRVIDKGWNTLVHLWTGDPEKPKPAARRDGLSPLACQVDPEHFAHLRQVHGMVSAWDDQIHAGAFSCVWKDRDEVRDFLDVIRAGTTATEVLTVEVRNLAREVRTTRNGNGGG